MAKRKPQPDPTRCQATSKSTQLQCRRLPIPGGTVCRTHGGAAPQVIEAARRRLLAAEANDQLARLGVIIETTPIEALEAMLWEAAGNVAVLRSMIADLEKGELYGHLYHHTGEPTGEAKPHVLVVMYNAERDRLHKLAEACAKLGLDERRVRLAEAQVAKIIDAAVAATADVGMTAEQTGKFKQAYAARLRSAQ